MCDRRPKHQAAPWWTCHDLTSLRQRVELFGSEALQLETLLLDGADWWPPSQEGVSRPKAFRSPGGLRTGLPNCWINSRASRSFTSVWVKGLMECAPPRALLSPHFCPLSMPSYFLASFILSDHDGGQPGCPSAQILLEATDSPSQQVLFSYRDSSPWRHQPSPLSLSDSSAWRKITPLAVMVNFTCQLS